MLGKFTQLARVHPCSSDVLMGQGGGSEGLGGADEQRVGGKTEQAKEKSNRSKGYGAALAMMGFRASPQ